VVKESGLMRLEFPLNASISLTGKCDFNCIHCLAQDTRPYYGLKTEKIKNIIKELGDNGCVRLVITGGEPLIRNDLFEVIDYAIKNGLCCHLNTNGSLITKNIAKEFRNRNISHIDVGVYAVSDEIFTNFCRASPELMKRVEDGIVNLLNEGINVQLMSCLTKPTQIECFEIIKHFSEKGVRFFTLSDIHPVGGAKNIFYDLSLSAIEYPSIIEKLEELSTKLNVEVDAYVPYFGGSKQDFLKNKSINRSGCSAGVSDINIWADGKVTACPYMYGDKFFMGDIQKNSVKQIWEGGNLLWFDEWSQPKKECFSCSYLRACKGGCPADTLFLTGNLSSKDPRCPFK
jgi:radical SAM protein with 4Fe4S-binding SPASM domain